MSFNPKAFGASFLEELSTGIKERGKEAKDYFIEQKEKADDNVAIYKERVGNMESAKKIAEKLMQLGATRDQVMYYAKDEDPLGNLRGIYKTLTDIQALKSQNVNYPDLTPDLISKIMDVPIDFKPTGENTRDFWRRTFNLTKQHEANVPSESDEAFMGNIFFSAMNINAGERVRRRLEESKYLGDISIADINRLAASKEYSDVFGGEYSAAQMDITEIPPVVNATTVKLLNKYHAEAYNELMGTPDAYTVVLKEAFGIPVSQQDEQKALTIIDDLNAKQGENYLKAKAYAEGAASQKTISDFALSPTQVSQVPILRGSL